MGSSAELNLKAALSLLNETAEITGDIQGLIRSRKTAENLYQASFWEGAKAQFRFYGEIGALERKLKQAVELAQQAKDAKPDVIVTVESVDFTPETAIGNAYFQKGLLSLGQERWKEAKQRFEDSLNSADNPLSQLFLGHALAMGGYREAAANAFQRVVNTYPESDDAVEARKALMELQQMKPKKWRTALLLSILIPGVDRFYLGYILKGCLKCGTAGGFGVWWVYDILRIATNTLRDANGMRLVK